MIGAPRSVGTTGVRVSVALVTHGATPDARIVTTITPAVTATDSAYLPAPVAMSGGTPSVPPSTVDRDAPVWMRDPLSHPDIEAMDARALGDLPFGLFRSPSLSADATPDGCRPA